MNTYKLGNKTKCIIRALSACKIGDVELQYKNQPYTILKEIGAELSFSSVDKNITTGSNQLNYQVDYVDELQLSNIQLNNKILNLIGSKNEEKLCNTSENCTSDDTKKIYLSNTSANKIYQVFIINDNGDLEAAYGELDIEEGISVEKENSSYLVCYSYLGSISINLEKTENLYLTIDLEIQGNIDDDSSTMWVHLEKCSLKADKTMFFRGNSNTIDLSFKVIKSPYNYITCK